MFEGEKVTFDQQKNLNAVIIGEKGQDLNNEIVALHEQSEEFANQKREKTLEFTRRFPDSNLEEFRALPVDTAIDKKIKLTEQKLNLNERRRHQESNKKSYPKCIQRSFFNSETLEKTLDVKQKR